MVEHFEQDPKRVESLRMQIDSLIQNYLNQKPIPSITDFAEVFGAESYVTEMKRQKAVTVNIKAFREEMVTKLLEQSEVLGTEVILPKVFEMLPQTILPPDKGEIKTGGGEGIEKKKYIPRTQYFIELLSEMGEQYEMIGGKNSSDMMRERTYFIFHLPNLKQAVFVNNEEGNTTFIIYQINSKQEVIDLAALTKDEIRAQELHSHPYVQVDWTGDEGSWKEAMMEHLTAPISLELSKKVSSTNLLAEQLDGLQENSQKIEERGRTPSSALLEFEEAYKQWKNLDPKIRSKFNPEWLKKNGYGSLQSWLYYNDGYPDLIRRASPELQKNFQIMKKRSKPTLEVALQKLEEAYKQWSAFDPETRGQFNRNWVKQNSDLDLYNFSAKDEKGGLNDLLSKASSDLQRDFQKKEISGTRTLDSALIELEVAHQEWKRIPVEMKSEFSSVWLEKNKKYRPLWKWAKRYKKFDDLIAGSSAELQKDFNIRK